MGYFENTECKEYKEWYGVMANVDDVTAIYITDPAIMDAMDVTAPAVVMYKKSLTGALTFKGEMAGLKRWIILHQLPLVVPFSQQYSRKLFAPEHGIKVQLMFFAPEKNPGEVKPVLEEVARDFQGRLFIVHIPSENARLLDYFGLTAEQIPALALADFSGEGMDKYLFEGAMTAERIAEFIEKFFAKQLTPFLKSEDAPAEQTGPVFKIVGKTFDQVVNDPKKNVFVKFYAPWCGHCKALAPTYEKLAEAYKDDPDVLIAEMDATANEVAGLNIRGFPTLKFYKAGAPSAPVDYEGERTLEALRDFVEKNRVVVKHEEEEL